MREILDHLQANAIVLDLCCSVGSFDFLSYPFLTVHVDLEPAPVARFVQADAARLPFRDQVFDAVICNHGLEHLAGLRQSLQEIGRVLKRDGALFVGLPDSTTLTDRLYRWLYDGGGHVNGFRTEAETAAVITSESGVAHTATRTLFSSFSYLNRRNFRVRVPIKADLVSLRWELPLAAFASFTRIVDRMFRTRLSVYGWAMYFGNIREAVDAHPWWNVCIRCGQGVSSACLRSLDAPRSRLGLRYYRCLACQALNFYFDDNAVGAL